MIFASNYVIEICPRFPSLPCHNLKVMSKCDGRLCFFLESSSLFRGFLFVFIVGKGLARGVPIYNSVVAPHDAQVHGGDVDLVLAKDGADLADHAGTIAVGQQQHVLLGPEIHLVVAQLHDARHAFERVPWDRVLAS